MKQPRIVLLLAAISALSAPLARAATPSGPVVGTTSGQVRGSVTDGVASWKGIPFAAPPVGALRWRAPQPVKPWRGVREANAYGSDCMQIPFPSDAAPLGTPPAEDCLYLNLWKPAGVRGKLPVVFWIYGGGFVNGGASPPTYAGANLARKGVVFVSFNYRLGRFGIFAHPALTRANADGGLLGNYGHLDQVAALDWVRRNVARFGGDPGNITVIGESAGGSAVHVLLTSPLTRGWFQKAIIMSGGDGSTLGGPTAAPEHPMRLAEELGTRFAATKGIDPAAPDAADRLRALTADQVVDGLNLPVMLRAKDLTWMAPFPDGRVKVNATNAYATGAFNKVPVMVGATSGDVGGNDGPMIAGARRVAATLAAAGVPVFAYRFSYVADSLRADPARALAWHASDIPFFFDTQRAKYGEATSARDNAMGEAISSYIAAFARTGVPAASGLPDWPRYNPAADIIMNFGADGRPLAERDPLTAGH